MTLTLRVLPPKSSAIQAGLVRETIASGQDARRTSSSFSPDPLFLERLHPPLSTSFAPQGWCASMTRAHAGSTALVVCSLTASFCQSQLLCPRQREQGTEWVCSALCPDPGGKLTDMGCL